MTERRPSRLTIIAALFAIAAGACGPYEPPDPKLSDKPPVADAGGDHRAVVGQPLALDGSASSDPDGKVVSWAWNFGDGTQGTGEKTTHTYDSAGSYVVTLTVTDDLGKTGSDNAIITVVAPVPVADIQGPASGSLGQSLSFDGSGSTDPAGTIVGWAWDFGDGTTGTGAQVSHAFSTSGTFAVKLTVTDDVGATGSATASVSIGSSAPVADIQGPTSGTVGQPLSFDGSGSSGPVPITTFAWQLGDGQTASTATVTHTYQAAGTYTLRLVVTDQNGATAQTTHAVAVAKAQLAIGGPFDVTATPASYSCQNGTYFASYGDTTLTFTVDPSGNVTAQGSAGHTFTGTLTNANVSATGQWNSATGGGCSAAQVQGTLNLTFSDATHFTGTEIAYFNLGVGCQCSAVFTLTGTHQ